MGGGKGGRGPGGGEELSWTKQLGRLFSCHRLPLTKDPSALQTLQLSDTKESTSEPLGNKWCFIPFCCGEDRSQHGGQRPGHGGTSGWMPRKHNGWEGRGLLGFSILYDLRPLGSSLRSRAVPTCPGSLSHV